MNYTFILEIGIFMVLGISPLWYGGATPYALVVQEVLIGILALLFLGTCLSQDLSTSSRSHSARHILRFPSPVIVTAGGLSLILCLHLIPLPAQFVRLLSPASFQLYSQAATTIHAALPTWLPLTPSVQATLAETIKLLSYGLFFFLVLKIFQHPKQILRLINMLLVMGFLEAFYGLLRFVSTTNRTIIPWVHGTFVNKNHFAGYLELIIPLAFASLLIHFEHRKSSSAHTFEEKYMKSLFFLFTLFLMICALLLSGSRGGLISFAVGMLGFTLWGAMCRLIRRWLVIMLVILAIALGVFVAVNPELFERHARHFARLEYSLQVRQEVWKSAWHIFQDFPALGSGLGTYAHLSRRYKTFQGAMHFRYAESDYAQFLAETGLAGMILLIGLTGIFLYRTVRAWKSQESRQALAITTGGLSAMFSLAFHGAVDFNLHLPSNMLAFCAIAAITYNAAHVRKRKPSRTKAPLRSGDSSSQRHHSSRTRPKSGTFRQGRSRARLVVALAGLLLYQIYVIISFAAFMHHQSGTAGIPQDINTLEPARHEQILSDLRQAIRYAPYHAEYVYTLGTYLYDIVTKREPQAETAISSGGLDEAEYWLKRAVMLDPANPWHYYALGRVHYSREDCHDWQIHHPTESWDACPVTKYFRAALENAPKNPFLREMFGRWYAFYDEQQAKRYIRNMLAEDDPNAPVNIDVQPFVRFLYDLQMDYESDKIIQQLQAVASGKKGTQCRSEVITQFPDGSVIEVRSDDGAADWKTPLLSETDRVGKILCLPEDIEQYQKANLLIFVSQGGEADFMLRVGVDTEMFEIPGRALPRSPEWHSIPIEMSMLYDKASIQVYLRVSGLTHPEQAPEIWGDAHTVPRDSMYNLRRTKDLSSEAGSQTGEYMIRLQLER